MNHDPSPAQGCLTIIALVGIVLFGVWIYEKATDPFYGKLGKYDQIAARQIVDAPYLCGKVVVVSASDGGLFSRAELDKDLQRAIPADLRAQRPDDVGTVILVRYRLVDGDRYTIKDGPHAARRSQAIVNVTTST